MIVRISNKIQRMRVKIGIMKWIRTREIIPNNGGMIESRFILIYSVISRSQTFDQNVSNSSRSFQDSTRSFSNPTSNGGGGGRGVTRSYVIHRNDVARFIGKGGATIKQIQSDYNVYIKVMNDSQNQWIDFTIAGTNDQTVDNAISHITRLIGSVKEKTDVSASVNQYSNETYSNNNTNMFNSRGVGRGRGGFAGLLGRFFIRLDHFSSRTIEQSRER